MAVVAGGTDIARRRAIVRRAIIAGLVIVCLVIFTGYFREGESGPLHGAQDVAAAVVAPVQEVATRAVQPVRDAWGWASSLRDARDRAAALETENEGLRASAAYNTVLAERVRQLEGMLGVEALLDPANGIGGYRPVTGLVHARSITDWYRSVRLTVGSAQGVVRNSPVVASDTRGAALVGIVTAVSRDTADVALITDGRTEISATVPAASSPPGLVRATAPGQLQLSGVPRSARIELNQEVVTSGGGSLSRDLPSLYPPGIPIGRVSSRGAQEVDVQQTVQVTPYLDPRELSYMTVLVPESREARLRASS